MQNISSVQRFISVLWPSFLMAGAATIVLATAIDPVELGRCLGGFELEYTAVYTVEFFLLWLLTMSSSLLTLFFQRPCHNPVSRPYEQE